MTATGGGFRDAAVVLDGLELAQEAALLRAAADGEPALWAVVDVREMRLVREMDYATGARPDLEPLPDGAAGLYLDRAKAEAAARQKTHEAYRGRTIDELMRECASCRVDELRHELGLAWRRELRDRVAQVLPCDETDPRVDDIVVDGETVSFDEIVELLGWRPFVVVDIPPLPAGGAALVAEAVSRLSSPREVQHLDSTSSIQAVEPSMEELREPRRTGRTTRHLKRWVQGEEEDE